MRKVEVSRKEGGGKIREKTIVTPWRRVEEAAAYCGLSLTAFTERAQHLPYGGDRTIKLYHTDTLAAFIGGNLPEDPYIMGLIHPVTGEIHTYKPWRREKA
ncbi:MAG: hypothetical protein WCO89_10165 [Syntrophus sp. (in: bacteria)]